MLKDEILVFIREVRHLVVIESLFFTPVFGGKTTSGWSKNGMLGLGWLKTTKFRWISLKFGRIPTFAGWLCLRIVIQDHPPWP